jgi:hypothetical protein
LDLPSHRGFLKMQPIKRDEIWISRQVITSHNWIWTELIVKYLPLPFLSTLRTPLRKKIIAPRGPRRDLWVVVITRSAYSKGEGRTPAATRPLRNSLQIGEYRLQQIQMCISHDTYHWYGPCQREDRHQQDLQSMWTEFSKDIAKDSAISP